MPRSIIHGIVKEIARTAARIADIDIINDYSLDFDYVDVSQFREDETKTRNNYSPMKGKKLDEKKGVYIFFNDNEVLYIGQSGAPKEDGSGSNLQERIIRHIVGNTYLSAIMDYFYKKSKISKTAHNFKKEYFKFLSQYTILTVSLSQNSGASPKRDYKYALSRLETTLIALLRPLTNDKPNE